jgi:hypothetical protein
MCKETYCQLIFVDNLSTLSGISALSMQYQFKNDSEDYEVELSIVLGNSRLAFP